MALLGKFMDLTTGLTFAANSGIAGPIYQTVAHGLGVAPDVVTPVVVSVGAQTLAPPRVEGIGGNASMSTVMLVASTLGNSAIAFGVLAKSYYSVIR